MIYESECPRGSNVNYFFCGVVFLWSFPQMWDVTTCFGERPNGNCRKFEHVTIPGATGICLMSLLPMMAPALGNYTTLVENIPQLHPILAFCCMVREPSTVFFNVIQTEQTTPCLTPGSVV